MKKIIDVSKPEDEVFALGLIDQVAMQNPNQIVGDKGTKSIRVRDKTFYVTRNSDSYTVKEGSTQGTETIRF